jgi:hypothetical protein
MSTYNYQQRESASTLERRRERGLTLTTAPHQAHQSPQILNLTSHIPSAATAAATRMIMETFPVVEEFEESEPELDPEEV